MSDSDAALVARTLGGDLHAYAALMARYRDKFGRYAFHMLGNREDAQEAMQDSFVRAYRALGTAGSRSGSGPGSSASWSTAAGRCAGGFSGTAGSTSSCRTTSPSRGERPDAFEWRDEIGLALDRLRPHYREAFLLRYVEGLEYAEMSEMTGAKEPALRMRVKRASDQLRELLRDVHAG